MEHIKNDDDKFILIKLQQLSSKELVVAAVDRAILHCYSSQKLKPTLNEFLELFYGQYIRLYECLSFATNWLP
ncbi:unnamed protein product [Rotaria sordida]|uniref:Uncharacterized protein n=1 Tax=Rotaria sordida TaxID=392033 RepID=A0A819XL37_9BILA|nr:unnamed protein product [Rotaria sordida]CAF4143839.1 unnamed protein product [Rotaria sordida]